MFCCVSNSKEVNHVELPKADKFASATQKGPISGGPVASTKKEIVDSKEECKRIDTREDDWGKKTMKSCRIGRSCQNVARCITERHGKCDKIQ